MEALIELHDSDLGDARVSENVLTIVLAPAYVHRSEGHPGIDPGTGWTQVAELAFTNAIPREGITASGELELTYSQTISDGWLHTPGRHWYNAIPAPLEVQGPLWFFIRAPLLIEPSTPAWATSQDVILEAEHLSVTLTGEPTYVDETEGLWLGGDGPELQEWRRSRST